MIFIKKLVEKKTVPTSLVKLLDERMAKWEGGRSHKKVHMSDLSRDEGFCPREFALLDATKKQAKGQYVTTALRVTFDNGSALASLCRNKWLEWDVVGKWRCVNCDHTETFSRKPKAKCKCGVNDWHYEEEEFIDPKSKSSGSIDFFIQFSDKGKCIPVEVKTISKDEFKLLKAPIAEHRIRTQLYLSLIVRSKRPEVSRIETDYAIVLYISKGFGAKTEPNGKVTPFREFVVEKDETVAKPYFKLAEAVQLFREGGVMPSGICPTAMSKRVASCSVGKECWGGSYPAGVK